MSSLNGVPQINRPSLSGLTSINADQFTLGNVTITANSISGIDTVNFNNFTVSTSAIFNCPASIYGNLIVSQNIINPALSNANTTIFSQLSNSNVRITTLENKTQNITAVSGLTSCTGNLSVSGNITSSGSSFTGIGSTAPNYRLDVQGTTSSTNFVRFNNFVPSATFVTWTQPAGISFYRHNGAESYMRMVSGNTHLSAIEFNTLGQRDGMIYYKHDDSNISNRNMAFYVSNSERVRINNLGNVGIGTTIPTNPLHVIGDINTTTNYRLNGNIVINSTTFGNIQSNTTALQSGNLTSHTKVTALENANLNIQVGNASAHTKVTALENANLNIQAGNASGHTRITTLESQTQLLSSNALVSVFSGNVALRSNVSLEKNIWNSCNIYSTSTPILNFYGDSIDGYFGTIQFGDGTGASRATISCSSLSGNLSMSYGLSLSGIRLRQSGTDLLTVNTANTWVQGNLNVNGNLTASSNQHYLFGNTTIQGNLICSNVNALSTLSFFLGNVGIGTTNAFGKLHVIGLSNIIGNELVTGNIGIGTTNPSGANLHIENQKVYRDEFKTLLLTPAQSGIYCYNSSTNNEAHSIICIRTNGSTGGSPGISLDINGIAGFSVFMDNADDSFKIRSCWDYYNVNSTYDCVKIDTSRRFFIYGEPSIRTRFHAIGSYAGSYTAGQNINFSYTVQDIAGTSSNSAGVLTLPTGYSGYYTVSCNGRFTDGNSTNGLYLYSGATNLFGSSDGVFWCPQDPSQRRCFSYTITRFLGGGNQIRAQMYGGTTFDLVLISVIYHGIQN